MSMGTMGQLRRVGIVVASCLGLGLLGAGSAFAETKSFTYTGGEQEFKVPSGVTSVHVEAVGGAGGVGGHFFSPVGGSGGVGAVVSGVLAVTPGNTLYVEVGGNGEPGLFAGEPEGLGLGGFNGGADSAGIHEPGLGGGGGGASDVRTVSRAEAATTLGSRLLVAAGGGGGGAGQCLSATGSGGAGGNAEEPGGSGSECSNSGGGAGAGTSTEGGEGGPAGEFGSNGNMGIVGEGGTDAEAGGGGGGGLYGGGGGGSGGNAGGGGGGSNLVPPSGEAKLAKAGEATSLTITYAAARTSKDQCKNGGWRNLGTAFKNQGQCVSFVQAEKRAA
jgi:hypothetical protein